MSEVNRKHRRYAVPWTVQVKTADWSEALQLAIGNLSRGGLFVRSTSPLAVGTRLEIVLQLPEGMVLSLGGEVVHAIPPERATEGLAPGFGLRFDEASAIDLDLLEGLAASNSDGNYAFSVEGSYVTLPATVIDGASGAERTTTAHKLVEAVAPEVEIEVDLEDGDEPAEIISRPDEEAPPADLGSAPRAPARRRDAAAVPQAPAVRRTDDEPVFGIDFGTSFTSIALVCGNQVTVLQDEEANSSLPSVVAYPEQGTPLVGWPAKEQQVMLPSTAIVAPKRLIGRRFDDRKLEPFLAGSPVRYRAAPDGGVQAEIHGEVIPIVLACREVFRRIAEIGQLASGRAVRRVAISAPVGYQRERDGIKRAAELAGLEVLGFVDEPVAAAMAFGLGMEGGRTVAVYDFGGGTFDFTLLRIKPKGGFEVLGEAGDPWLGGDDFDLALAGHAANQFWRETKVDLRQRAVEWQRLLFLCERAKRKLATEPAVELKARGLLLSMRGPLDLAVTFDRPLVERLCGELVERSLTTVDECLQMAGARKEQIDHVVLTGGTSRSTLVRQRLQDYFGREITLPYDPELAVVSGNALYGRFLGLRGARQRS